MNGTAGAIGTNFLCGLTGLNGLFLYFEKGTYCGNDPWDGFKGFYPGLFGGYVWVDLTSLAVRFLWGVHVHILGQGIGVFCGLFFVLCYVRGLIVGFVKMNVGHSCPICSICFAGFAGGYQGRQLSMGIATMDHNVLDGSGGLLCTIFYGLFDLIGAIFGHSTSRFATGFECYAVNATIVATINGFWVYHGKCATWGTLTIWVRVNFRAREVFAFALGDVFGGFNGFAI